MPTEELFNSETLGGPESSEVPEGQEVVSEETTLEQPAYMAYIAEIVKEPRSILSRIEAVEDEAKNTALTEEFEAIQAENLSNEERKEKNLQFVHKHADVLLTEDELRQMRENAAEALDALSGDTGTDEADTGIEGTTDEADTGAEGADTGEADAEIDAELNLELSPDFIASHALDEPGVVFDKFKALWGDSNRPDEIINGEGVYSVAILKNPNGVTLDFIYDATQSSDTEGTQEVASTEATEVDTGAEANWELYQKLVKKALEDAGYTVDIDEESRKLEITAANNTFEDNPGYQFEERFEDPMPEAEGILNDDGFVVSRLPERAEGDTSPLTEEEIRTVLPNAATRWDGTDHPVAAARANQEALLMAIKSGNIAEAVGHLLHWLMGVVQMINGYSEADDSNAIKLTEFLRERTPHTSDEPLYQDDRLRFSSFAAIDNSSASPGDKVAAAAILGVQLDTNCEDSEKNHCSAWVQTIAKKVGIARYRSREKAYVAADHPKYRSWYNSSPNKASFAEVGLKPGDMVIARSGGSPTGYHDQIVVDVDPSNPMRVCVASQTRTKPNGGGKHVLQWKTFRESDIATINRPGWTGANYRIS